MFVICFDIVTISVTVVTCFIFIFSYFDVGSMCFDFVNMVVTRGRSLSPPISAVERKSQVQLSRKMLKLVVILKRKEPENISQRKKSKAKRAKLNSKIVSSGVGGSNSAVISSSIVVRYLFMFIVFFTLLIIFVML